MSVRGLLFDIDDTLVDTASAFGAALTAALQSVADLTTAETERAIALWRADAGDHYRAFVAGDLDFATQRELRLLEITQALGLPRQRGVDLDAWNAVYERSFAEHWRLFPDAAGCVAAARAAGLAVGVVTNARAVLQHAKLAAVGMGDTFDTVVTLDTLGVGKPDPAVFHRACADLGTEPAQTMYVGDDFGADALGSLDAGLRSVWLDRPGRRRGGPHEVTAAALQQACDRGVHVVESLAQLQRLWAGGQIGAKVG